MDQKPATIETAASSAPGDRRATILIVEDSPVQVELLRRALEGAGYQVIVAGDGAEGLAMAKANHPVAVVSDINMPVMDGYAMCQAMRREASLKAIPVILLTMLSDVDDVIHGLNAGADAYLTKPYNIPALVARLASLLAYPPLPSPALERRKVKIRLAGEIRLVDAHGPRMLNLLISTYENAVLQNRDLVATQQALEDLNQHLEQRVLEKTSELRRSEQRFRALIENASDLILVIDAHGMITYVSPSAKRVGGYEPGELVGKSITAFVHPDDLPTALADLSELMHDPSKVNTTEFRYRSKEGDWIILETIGRSGTDDPAIAGVIVNARDITERKLAAQKLRDSEARYRGIFERARDVIYMIKADGIFAALSPSFRQVTGWSCDEWLGKSFLSIVHPDDTAHAMEIVKRTIADGSSSEFEMRIGKKTGSYWTGEFTVGPIEIGSSTLLFGIGRDITERKRAEEELRRLNWALRALGQSNSALVHAGTEKELFQACCDTIAGTRDYALAWIGLAIDDPAHSIEVVAAAGEAVKYMQDFEVSWGDTPHGSGPTGTAIRTGATQVTQHLAESDAYLPWREGARANGLASSISLPIRANGSLRGALVIYSREVDAFNRSEIELFEELALDIGYGIASRRTSNERDHLQQEQLLDVKRLKDALIGTIGAVALTVEKRDPYTAGHQLRVAELCVAIGRKLDLTEDRLEGLRLGATIHDIGKNYVPAEILNRPGKLTAPEFEIIKSHPQVGYDIIKDVKFPWPVKEMINQHHERLDGSGYPQGLKGEQIILEARILAVADVIEAMSSHRPYRAGLGLDAALAQARQEAGTQLDPQVVDACERVFHEDGFAFPKA